MKKPALFDTSIWVDFLNGKNNSGTKLLELYIKENLPLFICPIIIQEILQGIKDDNHYDIAKESILAIDCLTLDNIEAALGAANLYRSLRKKGITVRKSNDCLIAYYAIKHNLLLVHNDNDFNLIASVTPLRIYK